MEETIKKLEPWQEEITHEYYSNNAKKLYGIVDKILRKYGGITDNDEFYALATDCFLSCIKNYDRDKGSFDGFFYSVLSRKIITAIRDKNRSKRSNTKQIVDEDGKIYYEFNPDISINTPVGDGNSTLEDIIEDKNIDNTDDESSEKVEKYLSSLSEIQRDIVEMKMKGQSNEDIQRKLNISGAKLLSEIERAKRNKNILMFNKHRTIYKKTEEDKMQEMVMEIDTTDSYRMDKNTLDSLLDDKMNGDINCNYISQRLPFQWTEEKANKYFSRILNNQPITEIIICEVNEDGEKVCYLIDGLQRLSYAEAFKQGRIVCKKNGAEFTLIKYKDYELDSEGNRVFENGRPVYEYKEFDIIGKKYSELPEFLQKRFDKFNVNVTRYFNCTPEMVDYHIRNYNNYEGMSKSQYAVTSISNDTVEEIKSISLEHPFFKNNTNTTAKNETKGVLEEIVARTIMTLNYVDDWKKDLMDTLKFVDENASTNEFDNLKRLLDRFSSVATKDIKSLLTTANIPVWVKVFETFVSLGKDDNLFIKFMSDFKKSFINARGGNYDEMLNEEEYNIYISRNTRDKSCIKGKIDLLEKLML